jgi:predicted dehydrogenase
MLEFGPPRRNWTAYQQARSIAASGEFGRVQRVIGFWGNSVGGHGLDTVLYLAGDPEEVTSIRGTLDELSPAPGDTSHKHFVKDPSIRSALIEFADGPDIAVVGTGNLEFEVVCEGGLIRVRNDGEELEVRRKDTRSGFDPIPVEAVEHWCGTERKIRDLVQAIRTGQPAVSNLRIAMLSTEIGFGLYESHLRGGTAVRPPIPNRDRIVSSW